MPTGANLLLDVEIIDFLVREFLQLFDK